jgi:hypothetical protein
MPANYIYRFPSSEMKQNSQFDNATKFYQYTVSAFAQFNPIRFSPYGILEAVLTMYLNLSREGDAQMRLLGKPPSKDQFHGDRQVAVTTRYAQTNSVQVFNMKLNSSASELTPRDSRRSHF